MNLSRAKTILIFAFLGLNLFLCYHLLGGPARSLAGVVITSGEVRHAVRQLEESGYSLETKVDRTIRKGSFLTVTPSVAAEKSILDGFAPDVTAAAEPDGLRCYDAEGARIKIYPGGRIRLDLIPGVELIEDSATAEGRDLTSAFERFLQDSGLAFPTARFDHLDRSGHKTLLHYVQIFEGRPLFSGYLKANLENNILTAVDIYWFSPENPSQEREMEVIPVTEALSRLIEVLGSSPQPRRIIKADLGFYSREYDAAEWEVPPVWRFLFEDGESCYINALTGNLEPESSNDGRR